MTSLASRKKQTLHSAAVKNNEKRSSVIS
jgi:hypothetical protein